MKSGDQPFNDPLIGVPTIEPTEETTRETSEIRQESILQFSMERASACSIFNRRLPAVWPYQTIVIPRAYNFYARREHFAIFRRRRVDY